MRKIFLILLAFTLVFAMVGCDPEALGGGEPIPPCSKCSAKGCPEPGATYKCACTEDEGCSKCATSCPCNDIQNVTVTIVPVNSEDAKPVTEELTITFSETIEGLLVKHITLEGPAGVEKGLLTGSGKEYSLAITVPDEGGTLKVFITIENLKTDGITVERLYDVIGSPFDVSVKGPYDGVIAIPKLSAEAETAIITLNDTWDEDNIATFPVPGGTDFDSYELNVTETAIAIMWTRANRDEFEEYVTTKLGGTIPTTPSIRAVAVGSAPGTIRILNCAGFTEVFVEYFSGTEQSIGNIKFDEGDEAAMTTVPGSIVLRGYTD